MSKMFLRYAQDNAKYSVQRAAFLNGPQCQNLSFATRKIMQNVIFKWLLLDRIAMSKGLFLGKLKQGLCEKCLGELKQGLCKEMSG